MKQMLKSYHVFLPLVWERIIVYLLYPILLILISYLMKSYRNLDAAEACLILCVGMVVSAELFFDYFIFGGVAAKDTNKLEYLKTSARGIGLLQKALVGDWLRRLLGVGVIIVANYYLCGGVLAFGKTIICAFSTLFLIEAGLIITRFVSLMSVVVALIVCLWMCSMIVSVSVLNDGSIIWIWPVLYAAVSVLGRMLIIRKMKGSYYDSRD